VDSASFLYQRRALLSCPLPMQSRIYVVQYVLRCLAIMFSSMDYRSSRSTRPF